MLLALDASFVEVVIRGCFDLNIVDYPYIRHCFDSKVEVA